MLLEESSSTDGSDIIVLQPHDVDGDDASEDDNWGVLSMDGTASEHSGELILDGVEDEEEEENGEVKTEASQLSVPGTDSVPTVVGSIDGLTTEATTNNNIRMDSPPSPTPGFSAGAPVKASNATEAGVQTCPELIKQPNRPNRLALFLVVPALLLVPTTIASLVGLYNERNSLQMSVLELEDFVSNLQLEAEQKRLEEDLLWQDKEFLQLASQDLQQKVLRLKREAKRNSKACGNQLDHLQKERATLKLYVLHLQDKAKGWKKKAALRSLEGDKLFQDKHFLEWSASAYQQQAKALQEEMVQKTEQEQHRWQTLQQEKFSLQRLVAKAQEELARVQKQADKKSREDELRWNSLFQEKISLRVATARLEEQVSSLQSTAQQGQSDAERERDSLLSTILQLQDQVATLKRRDKIDKFLSAKANIQLGVHDFSESLSHWMETYSAASQAYAASNTNKRAVFTLTNTNTTASSAQANVTTPAHRTKSKGLLEGNTQRTSMGSQRATKKQPVENKDHLGERHWNATTIQSSKVWNATSNLLEGNTRRTSMGSRRATKKQSVENKVMRKVYHLGERLWNATTVQGSNGWNATTNSTVKKTVGAARDVIQMIRKVDSLGRAIWNATAFKMYKNVDAANRTKNNLSFFSRMDLNGKIWFESFFAPSPSRKVRKIGNTKTHQSSLDRIFQKVSNVILSAANADQLLEEASAIFFATSKNNSGGIFMSSTMEKLCSAMAFNHTSKKYLMKVTKNAFEEVSLAHATATSM